MLHKLQKKILSLDVFLPKLIEKPVIKGLGYNGCARMQVNAAANATGALASL